MATRLTLRPPAKAIETTSPYALPTGWQKRWDMEHDAKAKPLTVPYKASKRAPKHRRHNARRRLIQARNAGRKLRRARRVTGRAIRNGLNYAGATYECQICGYTVRVREADNHNLMHATLGHRYEPRTPLTDEQRKAMLAAKEAAAAAGRANRPVTPRQPSPTKAAAQGTPSAAQSTGTGTPPKPSQTLNPDASPTRRAWHRRINGGDMAGRNGNGASSPAAAIVRAHEAWAQTPLTTVADLKAHLVQMELALGKVADLWKEYAAQQLVAHRVHPAVAKPIEQAAEELAALRHRFTEAYIAFERIYADRLAHERNQTHKPEDSVFSDVG